MGQEFIFRSEYKSKPQKNTIDYDSSVFLIGSCFSENIGSKMEYFQIPNLCNPHGIIFNPLAIQNSLLESIEKKKYTEKDLFFLNEQWHSFNHHSTFSSNSIEQTLNKINYSIEKSFEHLNKATHLIITLGSAFIYVLKENSQTVANCHKVPQKEFDKKLLTVSEITETLEKINQLLFKVNPSLEIIYTVSPVRHLKDGMVENSLSKANLIAAIANCIKEPKTHYFPSYEIMMDDLRDYRFFKNDLVHPNDMAVTYIWEKFKETWISKKCSLIFKEIDIIQKGLAHKPFNSNSTAHHKFIENLKNRIEKLNKIYGVRMNTTLQ